MKKTKSITGKESKYVAPKAVSLSDFGISYGGPCRIGNSASDCGVGNYAANNCNNGNNAGNRCGVGDSPRA